ncbi:MAG: methyltransferase domain-containing protein [Anaerolineae bacterium]|nr:methyltransferase domain-containing protein [Anaerolineae bacterium]
MRFLADVWWRLVRFGFRLLYNELAFTYDLVSWVVSLGAWRCWQRSVIQFLPPPDDGPLLEVAHGTGNLHIDLKQAGYQVIGLDYSPYMGHITHRKLRKRGLALQLCCGRGQQLPFATGIFSSIVCTFPTSFVFEESTLTEFHRVLTHEGYALLVLSGVFVGGGPFKAFFTWLYRVTGQGASEEAAKEVLSAFQDSPFDKVDTHIVDCPHSQAYVIVLRKT